MTETPSSGEVSTGLQQVAELAKRAPQMAFTSLAHHIDGYFLHKAMLRTRMDGAPGVDGQTAEQYVQNRRDNCKGPGYKTAVSSPKLTAMSSAMLTTPRSAKLTTASSAKLTT